MNDGSLLARDWNTGSLFRWSAKAGMEPLAKGFKGPADFCVMAAGNELTVAAPDLPASVVRLIWPGRIVHLRYVMRPRCIPGDL